MILMLNNGHIYDYDHMVDNIVDFFLEEVLKNCQIKDNILYYVLVALN